MRGHYYLLWAFLLQSLANGLHYSQIVEVLVNSELSDWSVNWPQIRRPNLSQYPVMKLKLLIFSMQVCQGLFSI